MKEPIVPTMQELQIVHHCCDCGKLLFPGDSAMCAVIVVRWGDIEAAQRIAWCHHCRGGDYQ